MCFRHAAVGKADKAAGIGDSQHFGAALDGALGRVLGDVAGARNEYALAAQILPARLQHEFGEVNEAVAGRFRADEAAAVGEAFAGEHRGETVGEALVLAKEEADFTAANANITGGDVGIRANMAEQLAHEGLAEAHHFAVALAFWVKVGAAFGAAHRQRGQRVFEDLLEGEEFQHAQIDLRVKAQAAFVRADGRAHLHAVATVDLRHAAVINPRHAEHDDALRLDDALQQRLFGIARMLREKAFQTGKDFLHCLMKDGLAGVALLNTGEQIAQDGLGYSYLL